MPRKYKIRILFIMCLSLALTNCFTPKSGANETPTSTPVYPTQTRVLDGTETQATELPPTPRIDTTPATLEPVSTKATPRTKPYFEPLPQAVCTELADTLSDTAGKIFTVTNAPFTDFITQFEGEGCLITLTASGEDYDDPFILEDAIWDMFESRGWEEDINYAGGGPGAILSGFSLANDLCIVSVISEPSDMKLCKSDEAIVECWEKLEPAQRLYHAAVHCAQFIE